MPPSGLSAALSTTFANQASTGLQLAATLLSRESEPRPSRELRSGDVRPEDGYSRVRQTREEVGRRWTAFAELMERQGQHASTAEVRRFVDRMPPARTDREFIAEQILAASEHLSERSAYSREWTASRFTVRSIKTC